MELLVKNINKTYGKKKRALCDVTMSFTPGIYGLLGPNGSGKSTLMNIITDNLKADGGEVLYDGQSIHKRKEAYRAKIGYMPQQQAIYDNFTGEEFMWYMAALKGLDKKQAESRIESLIAMVNLGDEKEKKIGSYSGGMKQRILIAQALLNDPDILIMDEPTAGLDPSERIRIRNFLSEISENKIIIIATHIVSDIEFIAKEIILLKAGEIIDHGSPQQLLEELDGMVYEVETGLDEEYGQGDAYIVNIKMGSAGKIYRVISKKKLDGRNVKQVKAGLEELYMYHMI